MTHRLWILHEFLFLSIMAVGPVTGHMLNPSTPRNWTSFRVGDATQTLMWLEIQFLPSKEEPLTYYRPAGLLEGLQTPDDQLLSCSWPSAPPDRDDYFSAKWTGYWQPGEGKREIRLRASHKATLSMDGHTLLECQECPAGVTTTVEADIREHPLQVDYSHGERAAFIFLDTREPGRAWYPLEIRAERRNETLEGWKAEYYLGENFERLSFTRNDHQIAFDWKNDGPFDRPEDLPTLALRWGHRKGTFFSEVSSNRKGYLSFHPYITRSPTQPTAALKGTNTSLDLLSGDGRVLLGVLFDEGGTWWNNGKESDHLESTSLAGHPAAERTSFLVPVSPGRSIRFWEETPGVEGGTWIAKALDLESMHFAKSRPRWEGDLEDEGEALLASGRWWTKVYMEALQSRQDTIGGQIPAALSPARQRLIAPLATRLPSAVSTMVSLCMPDLSASLQGIATGQETTLAAEVLQEEATGDLEYLAQALRELESPGEKQMGIESSRRVFAHWPVTGLSRGLGNALKGFAEVSTYLQRSDDGGFRILPRQQIQRTVKFENWVVAEGLSLDLTLSPLGVRIERKKGAYVQFDRLIRIDTFRIGKKGEWITGVQVEGKVKLEAGPTKKLKGVAWNRDPLLMTKHEERFLQGTLPEGKGEIRVEWIEQGTSIPRF